MRPRKPTAVEVSDLIERYVLARIELERVIQHGRTVEFNPACAVMECARLALEDALGLGSELVGAYLNSRSAERLNGG